ncbi:MAG: hypothetical protein A2X52_08085 [Candidatus Rokubacteria bacterium GWC2_70_16]|nr:MAG: hypothetical protein A2X52_08085 [Candidatus Rokubacteria bacterium GWC2_70_16]
MARVLFVVAREQPELLSHLTHEFPEGDVSVVVDRRHGDRRQRERRRRAMAAGTERRGAERRGTTASAHELRALGYSIVRLEEDDFSLAAPERPFVNATAVRQVEAYLRDHFRYYTPVSSWDRVREGQAFVILAASGQTAHRVVFTKEFLDYYGTAMADRIPTILDEWKVLQHLELAGTQRLVVSSYGVRSGDD